MFFHYSFVPYRPLYWHQLCPNWHHPYLVKAISIFMNWLVFCETAVLSRLNCNGPVFDLFCAIATTQIFNFFRCAVLESWQTQYWVWLAEPAWKCLKSAFLLMANKRQLLVSKAWWTLWYLSNLIVTIHIDAVNKSLFNTATLNPQ